MLGVTLLLKLNVGVMVCVGVTELVAVVVGVGLTLYTKQETSSTEITGSPKPTLKALILTCCILCKIFSLKTNGLLASNVLPT